MSGTRTGLLKAIEISLKHTTWNRCWTCKIIPIPVKVSVPLPVAMQCDRLYKKPYNPFIHVLASVPVPCEHNTRIYSQQEKAKSKQIKWQGKEDQTLNDKHQRNIRCPFCFLSVWIGLKGSFVLVRKRKRHCFQVGFTYNPIYCSHSAATKIKGKIAVVFVFA